MADRTCAIAGCNKPVRSAHARWCAKHYQRWYRHGDPEALVAPKKAPRLYRQTHKPNHPLATKNGNVYVHRAVLFDAIGYGPHLCHWCGKTIQWRSSLHVDHLDGVGDHNDPSNLVPSCRDCNVHRGMTQRAIANRAEGLWQGLEANRPKSLTPLARTEWQPVAAAPQDNTHSPTQTHRLTPTGGGRGRFV